MTPIPRMNRALHAAVMSYAIYCRDEIANYHDHIPAVARVLRRPAGGDSAQSAFSGRDLGGAAPTPPDARRCVRVHERLVLSRQAGLCGTLWPRLGDHADARLAAAIDAIHPLGTARVRGGRGQSRQSDVPGGAGARRPSHREEAAARFAGGVAGQRGEWEVCRHPAADPRRSPPLSDVIRGPWRYEPRRPAAAQRGERRRARIWGADRRRAAARATAAEARSADAGPPHDAESASWGPRGSGKLGA